MKTNNLLTKLVLSLILFFAFVAHPSPANAQGSFNCYWYPGIPPSNLFAGCYVNPINTCVTDYSPNNNVCHAFSDIISCVSNIGPHDCEPSVLVGDPFEPQLCEPPMRDPAGYTSIYAGINTAIGCLPTAPFQLISHLIIIISYWVGGIALLLMIVGSIMVLTSRGNPEPIGKGKELFVNAVIGLCVVVFSWFLMGLIAGDILQLLPVSSGWLPPLPGP